MKKISCFLLPLLLLALSGCGPSRARMEKKISSMEIRLFETEHGFSRAGADSLVQEYQAFAEAFPGDSLAPVYLFKAATMVMNLDNGLKAIELFSQVRELYPDFEKTPLCLFFTGYVQENLMGDNENARESYMLFMETYPGHDFVDDAQASINNLGKTPEQMIEEFEEMQNEE